jgi:hypothetical protein
VFLFASLYTFIVRLDPKYRYIINYMIKAYWRFFLLLFSNVFLGMFGN